MNRPGVVIVVFACFCATSALAQTETDDQVVVTVNGSAMTLAEYYTGARIYLQLNQIPSSAYSDAEVERQLAIQVLRHLVELELLDQLAVEYEMGMEPETVDQYIAAVVQGQGLTIEALTVMLEQNGILFSDFYNTIRLELTRIRMLAVMVGARVVVSDTEVDAQVAERHPEDGLDEAELRQGIHDELMEERMRAEQARYLTDLWESSAIDILFQPTHLLRITE